eukprot:CAMPEP_0115882384 /NCGR_PEP_ID=MMETSP0287-20121206/28975_1 /TAXON_ID=412157 /ORGANISM="Chrysochromulina rotalis, Strain UIO044" /LENGTH=49 /DNA_ID= /DNA_START= /DNA_END= /DNA_ORIENTATION=
MPGRAMITSGDMAAWSLKTTITLDERHLQEAPSRFIQWQWRARSRDAGN